MGAFFLLRVNDHMQYLKKIKKTMEGQGDFRGGDHHTCKLGVWLDTVGPHEAAEVGAAAEETLAALRPPHELFHTASARALDFLEAGKKDELEREITDMHRASGQLVDLLLTIDSLAAGSK